MADFSGDPLPVTTPPGHRSVARVSSADMLQATVPVRATSGTLRDLVHLTLAVDPGDVLAIAGRVELTNDLTYTVGIGGEIRLWDASRPYTETWERISPYVSDNVQTSRHHIPLAVTAEWEIPSTWTPGGEVTIAMLVSAFSDSTARLNAHTLTVEDGYGHLQVERWSEDTVLTGVLARLDATEAAVTALQTTSAAQASSIAALASADSALAATDSVHTTAITDHETRIAALEAP